MTAERRSTAAARFSILMPLERSTRPASTEVRRSSQSLTGRWVRFSSDLGELADPDRLPALRAAHIDRIAQQDHADFALADELFQHVQIGADAGADQIGKALRGDAQGIADGQPDAAFSQVQGENSGEGRGQVISL